MSGARSFKAQSPGMRRSISIKIRGQIRRTGTPKFLYKPNTNKKPNRAAVFPQRPGIARF